MISLKSVFLCCQCDSQLSRFSRLQQELQSLKISITTAIHSLHLNTRTADISDISACFDQSVCSATGTESHSSLFDVSSPDILGTSAENITCNTTSTVSTPCSKEKYLKLFLASYLPWSLSKALGNNA